MEVFEDYVKEWFEDFVNNSDDLDSLFGAMVNIENFNGDYNNKKEFLLKMNANEIYEKLFYECVYDKAPATYQFLTSMFMQYIDEYLDNSYHNFAKEMVESMAIYATDYESPIGFFKDLSYGGCESGMIGMFIYNNDCMNFYRRYCNEMEEYREELEDEFGPLKTKDGLGHYIWMCWLCYEELAYRISGSLFPDEI